MRFSAGMPRVLVVIGSWISQVVSVDLQFGNPECGERKRSFKAISIYQTIVLQDRLGTNIGKALKKSAVFSQAWKSPIR
jgi:hypothetical protein